MSPGAEEHDDAALLRAVARGDEESLAALYDRHAVLALTCWTQLRIAAHTIPRSTLGHPAAVYPLIAQLTGWCAVTVAAAVCVDRSRYADLGGAVAAPVSLAAIALSWYAPVTGRFLVRPPASAQGVTIGWYAIAAAASVLTCVVMRELMN